MVYGYIMDEPTHIHTLKQPPRSDSLVTKLCVVHNWIWVSVFRCIQLQHSVTKINHIRWLFRSEFEIYRSALRFSVIIFNRKPEQITKINIYHININGCIHFSLDRAYTYVNVSSVCVCLPPRASVCANYIFKVLHLFIIAIEFLVEFCWCAKSIIPFERDSEVINKIEYLMIVTRKSNCRFVFKFVENGIVLCASYCFWSRFNFDFVVNIHKFSGKCTLHTHNRKWKMRSRQRRLV